MQGSGDELVISDLAGFVWVLQSRQGLGKVSSFRAKNGFVESLEMKFQKDIADVEEEGHFEIMNRLGEFASERNDDGFLRRSMLVETAFVSLLSKKLPEP